MIRFFDVFISLTFLFLISPLLILITFINVFYTKGKPFYIQKRIGLFGKEFRMIKFRTMLEFADKSSLLTIGYKDNRITKFGFFLRKFKIDEIPQILNVLLGEMSIVGPRPEVVDFVNHYSEDQKIVLSVKPGITDYASIEFFNENELLQEVTNPYEYYLLELMPKKIEMNRKFIEHRSVKEYFFIIWLTFKRIIF